MSKNTVLVVAALTAGALAWTLWPADDPQPIAAETELDDEFYNRFWIDRFPTRLTDKIDVFAIADPNAGAFQTTSAFEGDYTLFEWKSKSEGKLRIMMLQTRKKHSLEYKVSDKNCGEFDLCAKVKGAPRGAKRYFSMEDWVLAPGETIDAASLRARVRASLAR